MPVLRRPARPTVIELPPRKAEVAAETDVLVVGGGPAGIGAAMGAAAAGADVVVAERYGFLGGNATAALVKKRKVEGVVFETKSGPVVIRARGAGLHRRRRRGRARRSPL